jgi:hypothetical protein
MKNYSIKTAIYSLFILILFSQCSQRSESASEVATEAVSMDMVAATKEEAAPPTNQPNPVPTKTTDTTIQRMLTKEGTLRWETSDVEKTHAAILAQAKNTMPMFLTIIKQETIIKPPHEWNFEFRLISLMNLLAV